MSEPPSTSTDIKSTSRQAYVTVMSVLVYASVVRQVLQYGMGADKAYLWVSFVTSKLCHVGMATCHCGCHVIAALSRSGFAFDVLSCSLLELISSSIDRK